MTIFDTVKDFFSGEDDSSSTQSTSTQSSTPIPEADLNRAASFSPTTGEQIATPIPTSGGGSYSGGSSGGGGATSNQTPIPQEDLQQQSIATPQDLAQQKLQRKRASQERRRRAVASQRQGGGFTRSERRFIQEEEKRRQQTLTPSERRKLIARSHAIEKEQTKKQQTLTQPERRKVLRKRGLMSPKKEPEKPSTLDKVSNLLYQVDTLGGAIPEELNRAARKDIISNPLNYITGGRLAVLPSEVRLAGVSQSTKAGVTRTEATFTAQSSNNFVRGLIDARTSTLVRSGDKEILFTIAKGKTFRTGTRFPSTSRVVKAGKEFGSAELTVTKVREGLTIQKGVGGSVKDLSKLKKGTKVNLFKSGGVSKQYEDTLLSIGATSGDIGRSTSVNLIKLKKGEQARKFFVTGEQASPTITGRVSSVASPTSSLKNLVAQSVKIEVTSPQAVSTISRVSSKPVQKTTPPSQNNIQTMNNAVTQSQKDLSKTIPKVNTSPRSRPRTKSAVTPVSKTKTIQQPKQAPATRTIQKQVPIQRAKPLNVLKTIQKINKQTVVSFVPKIPHIPKTPVVPLKRKPRKRTRKTTPKYQVSERRFGTFKPVGKTSNIAKAINIGVNQVSSTLGATFKIQGLNQPINIKGFRTKVTPRGVEFIEPRRRRLGTRSEIKEIQSFLKPKKKKKKGFNWKDFV